VLVRRVVRCARLDGVDGGSGGRGLEGVSGRNRKRERSCASFERDGERAWRNVSR
jgi:hypothetical protein